MCLFGKRFLDGLFNGLASFASALLDAANQLMLHPFLIAEIIISQLAPSLFEFPFSNIPVTLQL